MHSEEPNATSSVESGVSGDSFRDAMSHLAGGVVLVISQVDGRPWGLTVTSCCAISPEPPLVAVSVQTRTATARSILEQGVFELALLSSHQRTLANHGSASGAKKFLDEALLADEDEEGTHNFTEERQRSLVNLRCRLVQAIQVSDHHLIVAQVDAVEKGTETSPLVYWLRQYRMVG